MNNSHQHPTGINIATGKLEVARNHIHFESGIVYKDLETMEQRVCLLLEKGPDPRLLRSATKPFATLHLEEPIMIGSYPIKHFGVFLLSASISGLQIDVVISPLIDKIDPMLRR